MRDVIIQLGGVDFERFARPIENFGKLLCLTKRHQGVVAWPDGHAEMSFQVP